MKAVQVGLVALVMLGLSDAGLAQPLMQCRASGAVLNPECQLRDMQASGPITLRLLQARVSQVQSVRRAVRATSPNLSGWAYQAYFNPFVAGGLGGQCTAFAFGRALEVTGKVMDFNGNPNTWVIKTRYPVGTAPKAGAIAVWSGAELGAPGHVAFVEAVHDGLVVITEANVSTYRDTTYGGGFDGSPRTLTEDQMADRTTPETGQVGRLLGYIYLQ